MKSEERGVRGEENINVAAALVFIRLTPHASLLPA